MARLRTNNTKDDGGDVYTRKTSVVTKQATPASKKYTPELAYTEHRSYGDKSANAQKQNAEGSMQRNKGFAGQMTEAQKKEQNTFKYKKTAGDKGFKEGLDYKAGKTEVTPGTPEERTNKKQISITHKGDVQSSNGYHGKGKDLESKGYHNQPGSYNYIKEKRTEWVDEDKVPQYLKDNPDAQPSGGVEHTVKGRAQESAKQESLAQKKEKPALRYAGRKK